MKGNLKKEIIDPLLKNSYKLKEILDFVNDQITFYENEEKEFNFIDDYSLGSYALSKSIKNIIERG